MIPVSGYLSAGCCMQLDPAPLHIHPWRPSTDLQSGFESVFEGTIAGHFTASHDVWMCFDLMV